MELYQQIILLGYGFTVICLGLVFFYLIYLSPKTTYPFSQKKKILVSIGTGVFLDAVVLGFFAVGAIIDPKKALAFWTLYSVEIGFAILCFGIPGTIIIIGLTFVNLTKFNYWKVYINAFQSRFSPDYDEPVSRHD